MIVPLNRLMAVLALCGLLVQSVQAEGDSVGSSDPPRTPEQARIALREWGIEYTQSAFLERVKKGDLFAVRLFRDAGMDLHAPTDDHGWLGWTALMWAAMEGRLQVVEFLVEHGADVNARTENGTTALIAAAGKGQLQVVEFLVEHGADINARTDEGQTSLAAAISGGRSASVRFLSLVRFLVNIGADIIAEDGETALMQAAREGDLAVMRLLVDRGADVNARTDRGWTALMSAASGELVGYKEAAVRFLVEHGADIHAQDHHGRTALLVAVWWPFGPSEAAVRLLVDQGADVNARDRNGMTVLMHAAGAGALEVVRFWWIRGPTSTPEIAMA